MATLLEERINFVKGPCARKSPVIETRISTQAGLIFSAATLPIQNDP
jgi:hypothetical protein